MAFNSVRYCFLCNNQWFKVDFESSACLSGFEMGVNIFCTLKLTEVRKIMQLSLSRRAREVAGDVS